MKHFLYFNVSLHLSGTFHRGIQDSVSPCSLFSICKQPGSVSPAQASFIISSHIIIRRMHLCQISGLFSQKAFCNTSASGLEIVEVCCTTHDPHEICTGFSSIFFIALDSGFIHVKYFSFQKLFMDILIDREKSLFSCLLKGTPNMNFRYMACAANDGVINEWERIC